LIYLTRLNHAPLILNSDLIEHVEVTPDTVISLTNGQKFMVLESADEVVEKVVQFRRSIANQQSCPLKRDGLIANEDSGYRGEHATARNE
jgi:flagellar protein FlbD